MSRGLPLRVVPPPQGSRKLSGACLQRWEHPEPRRAEGRGSISGSTELWGPWEKAWPLHFHPFTTGRRGEATKAQQKGDRERQDRSQQREPLASSPPPIMEHPVKCSSPGSRQHLGCSLRIKETHSHTVTCTLTSCTPTHPHAHRHAHALTHAHNCALMFVHTHSHIHTHLCTSTHKHPHTCAYSHSHTCTLIHSCNLSHSCSHPGSHPPLALTLVHTLMHAHPYTPALALTHHRLTHQHTHRPPPC